MMLIIDFRTASKFYNPLKWWDAFGARHRSIVNTPEYWKRYERACNFRKSINGGRYYE